MAEIQKHGTTLKLNGPPKAPAPTAPKQRIFWFKVLMSHADGQMQYKAGTDEQPTYRGLESRNRAEELAKRGLIDPTPYDKPDGTVDNSNPLSISTPDAGGGVDKARAALDAARASVWRPGMKPAEKTPAPAEDVYEEEPSAYGADAPAPRPSKRGR